MAVEDIAVIPWGRGRESSNAEHTGVYGVVDQPLGAVVSADKLTVSFVSGMGVRMESTYSATSPVPPNRSQGVRSAFTSAAGACIGNRLLLFRRCRCHTTCHNSPRSQVHRLFRSARGLSWPTCLAAAPARPVATFLRSFILGTTGPSAGAVTLSTGITCSTPFVDSGVGWISPSIWLIRSRIRFIDYSGNILLSKSVVS